MAKHLTRPGKPGGTVVTPAQASLALEAKAQVDYGDTCPGLKLANTWGVPYEYVLVGLDFLLRPHVYPLGPMYMGNHLPRDWGIGLTGQQKDIFLAEIRAIAKRFTDLSKGRAKL